MTLSDISYWKNARNASVTSRSWNVATMAPTPKLIWKRHADVQQDAEPSTGPSPRCPCRVNSCADDGSDNLAADDLEVPAGRRPSARSICRAPRLSDPPDFACATSGSADHHLMCARRRRTPARRLDAGNAAAARCAPARRRLLLELRDHDRAARELDAERDALRQDRRQRRAEHERRRETSACQRQRRKLKFVSLKICIKLDADRRDFAGFAQFRLEERLRNEDRREQVRQQARRTAPRQIRESGRCRTGTGTPPKSAPP